jgi:transcriptional regulator with XRE-family HTH domain
MNKNSIGSRLAAERKRLGLNQSDFARLCGVRSASQFLYEKDTRSPSAEYLSKAMALGVRLGYVFDPGTDAAAESLSKLTWDQIIAAYKQTDTECRDSQGRLFDLEHRIQDFRARLDSGDKFKKVANENV